jgi:hypothetical protein
MRNFVLFWRFRRVSGSAVAVVLLSVILGHTASQARVPSPPSPDVYGLWEAASTEGPKKYACINIESHTQGGTFTECKWKDGQCNAQPDRNCTGEVRSDEVFLDLEDDKNHMDLPAETDTLEGTWFTENEPNTHVVLTLQRCYGGPC